MIHPLAVIVTVKELVYPLIEILGIRASRHVCVDNVGSVKAVKL